MKCIDVHCYYGKWPFPIPDLSIKDILGVMEILDIEKSILMSGYGIQYDFVAGNADLAERIRPYDNLYGYVYINMNYPEMSLAEVDKYLGTDKFVGVKYQGEYSRTSISAPANRFIFDHIEQEYQKPILMHTWGLPEHGNAIAYSLPSQALELARQHPKLNIIMGHMGGTEWPSAIEVAKEATNLYLDTCASYADNDKIASAVRALGADRVLFGSSMTENNPFMQKAAVLDADITTTDREQVLYANARHIFGI